MQIEDRVAFLEHLGIESLVFMSDIVEKSAGFVTGSTAGLAFQDGGLEKLGLGGQAFHDFCRGRAVLKTLKTFASIKEEGMLDEVATMGMFWKSSGDFTYFGYSGEPSCKAFSERKARG